MNDALSSNLARPKAFTLIEMMIAIAIFALLATAAVLSFAGPLRSAQMRDAVEVIRAADAGARSAAQKFDRPVRLRIGFEDQLIERFEGDDPTPTFRAAIPKTARIDGFRNFSGARNLTDASISYSPLGLSHTYALRLSMSDESRWLVFAGLSGQMTQFEQQDEAQLSKILGAK